MRKFIIPLLLVFLLSCCSQNPSPQVTSPVTDVVPAELADPIFWMVFWERMGMSILGATVCYGEYGSITKLNPRLVNLNQIRDTEIHESVHRDQVRRYGCKTLVEKRKSDPRVTVMLEAEAMYAEGQRGEEIVSRILELLSRKPRC